MEHFIIQTLLKKGIRPSIQRIQVYHYLLKHKNHPTAERIYTALHASLPTLSKTTIYNTLSLLEREGLVQSLPLEGGEIRYDADVTEHIHFKCIHCSRLFDLSISDSPNKRFLPEGFTIDRSQLFLWGKCRQCNEGDEESIE